MNLKRDALIYGIGDIGSRSVGFLLIPLFTYKLTPEEYGIWDLIITTQAFLIPIVSLQIMDATFRFLITEQEDVKSIITSSSAFVILSSIIYIFIFIIFYLANFIELKYSILIIYFYFIHLFNQFLLQTTRGIGNIKIYAIGGIANAVVGGTACIILILLYNMSYDGVVIGSAIGLTFSTVYLFLGNEIWRYLDLKQFKISEVKRLLSFSVPLVPNTISWWLINLSDRYLILLFLTPAALGIYSLSVKISGLILILSNIFMRSWQKVAIDVFESSDVGIHYTSVFNVFLRFQFFLVACLTILMPFITTLFLGPEFESSSCYIPIIALGAVFYSFGLFYGTVYWGNKKTWGASGTTIVAAVLNLGLNLIFLRLVGVWGAVISTVLSYLILWILRVIYTRRYMLVKIDYSDLAMGLLLVFMSYPIIYLDSITVKGLVSGSLFLFVTWFYRDLLFKLYGFGKSVFRN